LPFANVKRSSPRVGGAPEETRAPALMRPPARGGMHGGHGQGMWVFTDRRLALAPLRRRAAVNWTSLAAASAPVRWPGARRWLRAAGYSPRGLGGAAACTLTRRPPA